MLPDGKSEGRVQYVEEQKGIFVSSKHTQSFCCITYLKWNAIEKKQIANQKLVVPWNDEIQVVKEEKSKWPTVHGFLSSLAKRFEEKRDW